MALAMTLILGGLTGWLISILVKTELPVGILASTAAGGVGSLVGLATLVGFGLQPHSVESWTIAVVTAVLSATWLVGTLRATVGLFSTAGGWR